MTALRVASLAAEHVVDAAGLAAARVAEIRRQVPLLPERWQQPGAFIDALQELVDGGDALVALSGRQVVGLLGGYRWERAGLYHVHSPVWANVCLGSTARTAREALYTELAARWIGDGVRSHFVSLLPSDQVALETLQWLGFGIDTVDALRSLEPVPGGTSAKVVVAEVVDAEDVLVLEMGLRRHLAASPLFFPMPAPPSTDELEKILRDEAMATLMIRDDCGPVGYLRIGPASDDASTIIRDDVTASISRAFTRPDSRRTGIATTLLNAALEWARARGYARCAVDFESANLLALRFWLRQFTIVGLTLRRRI